MTIADRDVTMLLTDRPKCHPMVMCRKELRLPIDRLGFSYRELRLNELR